MMIGMNMTFGPMHIIGLQGQPRRMYQLDGEPRRRGILQHRLLEPGLHDRHLHSRRRHPASSSQRDLQHRKEPVAPLDPWDARSLEWLTTNPPKPHNFDRTPTVHALDEVFHRKYEDIGEGDEHEYVQRATLEELVARRGSERRRAHPPAGAVLLADRPRVRASR